MSKTPIDNETRTNVCKFQSTGFDEYPIRKSLTRLKDARWKHVRSLLNPIFTTAKLRQVDSLMSDLCSF